MLGKEKILVTGAGGFIGGWLAETLYLRDPDCIRAGVHSWVGAVRPARFPMEIVPCDLLKPQQISDAMNGVSYVVHCAKGSSEESIVQGTKNILEIALQQKVKRFVYISTAEVYGNRNGFVDETVPNQLTGDVYGDSKNKAEQLCWDYYSMGLPVTIIRPSIVYGPFSKTWSVNIAQKLRSGNWNLFEEQGDGTCNLIYISDLITGILLTLREERAIGEAFNLTGPEKLTWNEYFEKFNGALGYSELRTLASKDARFRASVMEPLRTCAKYIKDHFSAPIRKVAAVFPPAKSMMKFVEVKMKTLPQKSDFNLFNRKAIYVSTKAQDILGYKPVIDLHEGLKLTIPWLRQTGFIE